MTDLIKHRHMKRFFKIAFLIWCVVITALYFYYFPGYGYSFLWIFENFLLAASIFLMLASLSVVVWIALRMLKINLNVKKYFRKLIGKISKKNKLEVPLLFFPIFLFACSLLWILYIFKFSNDLYILANDLYTLFIVAVLAVAAFSLGCQILKIFKFVFSGWLEKFLLCEAIGFGALMLFMYFLGVAGLYYKSIAYGVVFLAILFSRREIISFLGFLKNYKITWNIYPAWSIKNFLLLAVLVLSGIYVAGIFQQYPVGWDELHTYAAIPKEYALHHGIINFPYWVYSGFPQYGEMLYTLGFLLYGFNIVPGIVFVFSLLSSALVFFAGKTLSEKNETGLLAVALFLTLPMTFFFNFLDSKVDVFLELFSLLSFFYLVLFLREKKAQFRNISFVFLGLAAGIKYTFFPIILPSYLSVILISRSLNFKQKIRTGALALFFVGILFLPWAAKNYYYTGNPVEPLLGDILSTKNNFMKSLSDKSYANFIEGNLSEENTTYENQEIKDYKYYFSIVPRLFFEIKSQENSDLFNPSPVFLLGLPLLVFCLFLKKVRSNEETIAIFSFIGFGFLYWCLFSHQFIWYTYSLLALLTVVLAHVVASIAGAYKKIAYASIFVYIAVFTIVHTVSVFKYQHIFTSYDGTNNDLISISSFINSNSNGEKTWLLTEPTKFYLDNSNTNVISDLFLINFSELLRNNSEDKVFDILKKLKVKYFLYSGQEDDPNLSYWLKGAMENMETSPKAAGKIKENHELFFKFRDEHLALVKEYGIFYLYELKN